jgi:hypothetical protein
LPPSVIGNDARLRTARGMPLSSPARVADVTARENARRFFGLG